MSCPDFQGEDNGGEQCASLAGADVVATARTLAAAIGRIGGAGDAILSVLSVPFFFSSLFILQFLCHSLHGKKIKNHD